MAVKVFECGNCDAFGKVTVKNEELSQTDIVYCPVCGGDISVDEEETEDDID